MLVAAGEQSNTSAALHETWETSNHVRRADGHTLAFFNPYYQVRRPSRFHDPALHPTVERPIEAGVDDNGPMIGDDRTYSGAGTRAPN